MEEIGYKNYYKVLNAKDYGIPQNRERIFTVSILGSEEYSFPKKIETSNLENFLDKTIINQKKEFEIDSSVKPSVAQNFEREKEKIKESNLDIYNCECTSGWQDNKIGIKISPTIRANNNNTYVMEKEFKFPKKKELKILFI